MSDAVSEPATDGKFSVGKMLAKTGVQTGSVGVSMSLAGWGADTLLAWIDWFNRQPDYSVMIRLPAQWATIGGMTLVIYGLMAATQDVLRYYGYWPRILD